MTAMANTSTSRLSRRLALQLPLAGVTAAWLGLPQGAMATVNPALITVWKNPDCGCCKEWIAHLQKNGFEVLAKDVPDTAPIRQKLGLPAKFGACHTAQMGAYVLEGHVPAQEVRRLLREQPRAVGLAVPGMPVGSPGMEVGKRQDPYDVLLVLADGSSRVYQSYPSKTVKSSLNFSLKS